MVKPTQARRTVTNLGQRLAFTRLQYEYGNSFLPCFPGFVIFGSTREPPWRFPRRVSGMALDYWSSASTLTKKQATNMQLFHFTGLWLKAMWKFLPTRGNHLVIRFAHRDTDVIKVDF
ncbi:MAG: hypothetical protein U0930_00795 [Pirellulales bacterium]